MNLIQVTDSGILGPLVLHFALIVYFMILKYQGICKKFNVIISLGILEKKVKFQKEGKAMSTNPERYNHTYLLQLQ